jgi:hypothetical protein
MLTSSCYVVYAQDCNFFREKVVDLERLCRAGQYCEDLASFRQRMRQECGEVADPQRPVAKPPRASAALALECQSSAKPSCNVYERCFERTCNCEKSVDRYFISYGKKYCERFLQSTDWSQDGRRWRDKTLICLQETIVPNLPQDGGKCDCAAMKRHAFEAHVRCYTQPESSICDLNVNEWLKIRSIIGTSDLFLDSDGRQQLLQVVKICLRARASSAARAVWNELESLLGR